MNARKIAGLAMAGAALAAVTACTVPTAGHPATRHTVPTARATHAPVATATPEARTPAPTATATPEATPRAPEATHAPDAQGRVDGGHKCVSAACEPLSLGSHGEEVAALQWNLNRVMGFHLAEDGDFGPQTDAALRAFQARVGITVDGVYGPQSEAAMAQTYAND